MTVATDAELGHLDWDVPVVCSGRGCDHEGVALVKFRVHEECKAHYLWYVACQTHLDQATSHRVLCDRCGLHLSLFARVNL